MYSLNILFLLALGFVVGLSGALIPGPLLIYTINESLKRGKNIGLQVITGHAMVEVIVILILLIGVKGFIKSDFFISSVSLLGGIALILMGFSSLRVKEVVVEDKNIAHDTLVGGIVFTAFNPSFPIWWLTAGSRLLIEGYQKLQIVGMLLVVVGHWIADFGWYYVVSKMTTDRRKLLFEKGWYINIRRLLSIILILIGLYFLAGV